LQNLGAKTFIFTANSNRPKYYMFQT